MIAGEVEPDLCFFSLVGEANILVIWSGVLFLEEVHLCQHKLLFGVAGLLIFQVEFGDGFIKLGVVVVVITLIFHRFFPDVLGLEGLVLLLGSGLRPNGKNE